MSTIIIIAVVIGVITLFNIVKELVHINNTIGDWRNDWAKEHGYQFNGKGYRKTEKHGSEDDT